LADVTFLSSIKKKLLLIDTTCFSHRLQQAAFPGLKTANNSFTGEFAAAEMSY